MGTWTSRRRASSIRGARLDRLRSAWTLFGPLLGWALLGGALGAITGARLVASNPTIQGPDRIVAIADLAIGAAVVAALFGLFITALACPLRPRTRARLRLRPFRRAVVACGASLSVVLLASALAGGAVAWLVAAVLMALIAAVVTARLNDPALLGNLLLTCLALGSLPFIGDIVGAAFATAPDYVPFEGDFQTRAGPVVLIGIDGADWARIDPLLKAGRLPAIEGLLSNGLRAPLASETPTWSPNPIHFAPIWVPMTIASIGFKPASTKYSSSPAF